MNLAIVLLTCMSTQAFAADAGLEIDSLQRSRANSRIAKASARQTIGVNHMGVLAEDLENMHGELIAKEMKTPGEDLPLSWEIHSRKTVSTTTVAPLGYDGLLEELKAKVENLSAEVATLKTENANLKAEKANLKGEKTEDSLLESANSRCMDPLKCCMKEQTGDYANKYVVGGSSVWFRVSDWQKCRDMCFGHASSCKSFSWYGEDEKNMPSWKKNCKLMSTEISSSTRFSKRRSCCTVQHWSKECHASCPACSSTKQCHDYLKHCHDLKKQCQHSFKVIHDPEGLYPNAVKGMDSILHCGAKDMCSQECMYAKFIHFFSQHGPSYRGYNMDDFPKEKRYAKCHEWVETCPDNCLTKRAGLWGNWSTATAIDRKSVV